MTTLRPHLKHGYAEPLDSFGNVAAEWWDRKYTHAILNGECDVHRRHQMFHELAVREGHSFLNDGCWIKHSYNGKRN
jgi:hypothetical protein